jgi:hypothetical protein
MKVMKKRYVIPLLLVCLGVWVGNCWGRSLEVDAKQAAEIKPSEGSEDVRLVVRFEVPDTLEGKSIDFACVSFGADCSGVEGGVSFQGFPLSKAWDGKTVSWESPWDRAGGDWDNGVSACGISEAGSGKTVELDVTEFANRWLKEPSKNFGILVKVSGPFFGTFSTDRSQGVPKLRILYPDTVPTLAGD